MHGFDDIVIALVLGGHCLKLEHCPSVRRKDNKTGKGKYSRERYFYCEKEVFSRSDSTPLERDVSRQFGKSDCLTCDSTP
jgi:hypothetical protein